MNYYEEKQEKTLRVLQLFSKYVLYTSIFLFILYICLRIFEKEPEIKDNIKVVNTEGIYYG